MAKVKSQTISSTPLMNNTEDGNAEDRTMEQIGPEEKRIRDIVKNLSESSKKLPQVLLHSFEGNNNSSRHSPEEDAFYVDRLKQILSNLDKFDEGMPDILKEIQELLAKHIKESARPKQAVSADFRVSAIIADMVKKRMESVVDLRARYQRLRARAEQEQQEQAPTSSSSSAALLKLAKTYVRNTRYLFRAVNHMVNQGAKITMSET